MSRILYEVIQNKGCYLKWNLAHATVPFPRILFLLYNMIWSHVNSVEGMTMIVDISALV